jgi:hypothetical protein
MLRMSFERIKKEILIMFFRRSKEKDLLKYAKEKIKNNEPLILTSKEIIMLQDLEFNGKIQIPIGTVMIEVE